MTYPASGRFKDRVNIQTQTTTEDAYGDPLENWTTQKSRRADIQPINGKEYFSSQGERNQANYRIRLRYEKNLLTTKMRLTDARTSPQRVFDIESIIDPGNYHEELICMCVERI